MVSCLMGDSTALASAIVRCCPKVFVLFDTYELAPGMSGPVRVELSLTLSP